MKNKKTNKTKDVIKELGLPVAGSAISIFNPFIGVGVVATSGVWTLVNKWRNERVKEVKKSVGSKRLLEIIQRDDRSKDILHKILFNILQEESKRKRELYYNYISQLHKNINPSFDYHSKIILTINSITFDELDSLVWLADKYDSILRQTVKKQKKENPGTKVNAGKDRGLSVRDISDSGYFRKKDSHNIWLEDRLVRLGNYGLVAVKNGRFGGTFFGPISDFGEIFLQFIKEKSSEK